MDLETLEESETLFLELIRNGRRDLEQDLIQIFREKALVLTYIDDRPGAIVVYNEILERYQKLLKPDNRMEIEIKICEIYNLLAVLLAQTGKAHEAIKLFDKGFELAFSLDPESENPVIQEKIASGYANKAAAHGILNQDAEALALYDKAIEILTTCVNKDDYLSRIYNSKAALFFNKAEYDKAFSFFDKAIDIRERLYEKEGEETDSSNISYIQGLIYSNLANSYLYLDQPDPAEKCIRSSIDLLEQLVFHDGHNQYTSRLANAYFILANILGKSPETAVSTKWYDKSSHLLERLIFHENHTEFKGQWAMTRAFRACHLFDIGDLDRAHEEALEVSPILKEVIDQTGRTDLKVTMTELKTRFKDSL